MKEILQNNFHYERKIFAEDSHNEPNFIRKGSVQIRFMLKNKKNIQKLRSLVKNSKIVQSAAKLFEHL